MTDTSSPLNKNLERDLESQAWWLMAVIQAVGRLEQEDWHEFKSSLGYRMRLVSKTQRERAGVWRRGQTDR